MNRTLSSARRPVRLLVAATAAVVSLTVLGGCGAIFDEITSGGDAPRDEPGGEITASAEADAFEILTGDCIDLVALDGYGDSGEGEEFEVESVPVVPCAEEHTGEVYAELVMDTDTYPGDEGMSQTFDDWCYAEFEKFVGLSFEESVYSYTGFYPTQETWEQLNDRTLQCIISSEEPVTGSLEGIAE
ncbi:septum formation family protein [Promicromonospora sp. Populi]|uniref:septum formation family protein n=1 Tax=Promicromonospora sp. Populi TaxID=3239420 RepID=UPI0034E26DB4